MAADNSALRTSPLATDLEGVMAQLTILREDLSRLASHVADTAGRRGETFARELQTGAREAGDYLGRKSHEADVRLEKAVGDNPYIALGIAAALGLVIGAMSRR